MKQLIVLAFGLCATVYANPLQPPTKHHSKHTLPGHPGLEHGTPEFWFHLGVSVCLVLAGGVFAG